MEDKLYRKIEAYIGGDMSEEESLEFENQLNKDFNLKNEVELYNKLNHYLTNQFIEENVTNEYTEKLKKLIESDEAKAIKIRLQRSKEHYHKKQNFFFKYKYVIASSVAGILLILLLRLNIFSSSPSMKELYFDYYDKDDLPTVITRNDSQNNFYKVINAFENKDYEGALHYFNSYEKSTVAIDTLLYLYKGMIFLHLNEHEKAKKEFQIVSNSDQLDKSKGLWFEALLFLKLNNEVKARNVLEELVRDSTNFKFKEAKNILTRLN